MHVHPVLPWNLKLQQPQLPRSEPDEQPNESSHLAKAFGVSVVTIDSWKIKYPEFLGSLKVSKEEADNGVERSLYARATGYTYDAVKIFHTKDGKVIKVPYTEHVPPDVTACIFWLKNRRKDRWRDVKNIDADIGHYIISDKPMTEEEWIAERAMLVTPALPQELERL